MAPVSKETKQATETIPKEVKATSKPAAAKLSQKTSGGISSSSTNGSVLEYTPLSAIPQGVDKLRESFHTKQKTHSIQYRLNQLRNLYFAVKDNADELCEALYKDFYRVPSETKNLEVAVVLAELVHVMANLHKWIKPEPVEDVPVSMKTTPIYVERIPLGVVLVISPFNYPLMLSLSAVVGALSAGNAVVLKQSELVPHFSQLFTEILTKALDDDIFFAVNGAIPETTELLEQKFDKIIYTGNGTVAKIVSKKAAETLTPVILELGGKSPAILLNDVKEKDISTIARRIVWGRFSNAGQTCVAVDYVLVPEILKDILAKELVKVVKETFYADVDKDDPNFTHLIHDRAFRGLSSKLDQTKGNILVGGLRDEATRFISPTIIDNVSWDDSTMQDELFGPILPILTYNNLDTALREIVTRHDTPLALYIFTSGSSSRKKNPAVDKIRTSLRSGGVVVNDVLMHVALTNAPFGGVGQSGVGAYHGIHSFKQFSHERTVMEQKLFNEAVLSVRYPPHKEPKDKVLQLSLLSFNDQVWFGRTGDVKIGGPNYIWAVWYSIAGVANLGYQFVKSSL